eukprot:539046_1
MQPKDLISLLEKNNLSHKLTLSLTESDIKKLFNKQEQNYKILYEQSERKVELLQNEINLLNNSKINNNKQFENKLIQFENNKNQQISNLNNKHLIEINDLKLKLKCKIEEFTEYKREIKENNIVKNNSSIKSNSTIPNSIITHMAHSIKTNATNTSQNTSHKPQSVRKKKKKITGNKRKQWSHDDGTSPLIKKQKLTDDNNKTATCRRNTLADKIKLISKESKHKKQKLVTTDNSKDESSFDIKHFVDSIPIPVNNLIDFDDLIPGCEVYQIMMSYTPWRK